MRKRLWGINQECICIILGGGEERVGAEEGKPGLLFFAFLLSAGPS